MANIPIISLNTGEVTPQIDARADIEKYASSCRTLENMIPRIYGGVERRPGTEYIYEAKYSPQAIRLVPFIYSSEIAYMCEFGNLYIRFYYDGEILLDDDDNPVEVESPYLVGDLPELQCGDGTQIGDTMWLVHKKYHPMKLTRTTATSFSLDEIVFETGPFLTRNDLNAADGITLTSSVTTDGATGTLTASGAVFDEDHVGALFKLVHPRETTMVSVAAAGTSDAIDVEGTFHWTTHGNWTGTVKLERNENSAGWETYRTHVKVTVDDANIQLSSTESADDVQYRTTVVAGVAGTVSSEINIVNPDHEGIVRIDSVGGTTSAGITVVAALASTDATIRWAEGSWSSYRGWPAAFCFFENRAVYAGSTYEPQMIWFSATDDYEDFDEGVLAADSFSRFIPTTNDIRWIAGLDVLCVGTSGDEWIVRSNKLDTAMTPTSVTEKQVSQYGSAPVQAVKVNNSILFLDYVRRKVREFRAPEGYSDEYPLPADLTALAEHITESGLVALAHQKNPDSILWSVRADGVVDSMSYEREQNVVGWARHLTGEVIDNPSGDSGVGASTSPIMYINENAYLWCLSINDKTPLTLDADGVAVNVGGGIVGLPCAGHPFTTGDIIRISGTTSYSGAFYTLTSGTTADELQFTGTYVAETFDGTEIVVKRVAIVESGPGRMTQDSQGNLYISHTWDTTNSAYVTKIDLNGNKTYDFITLESPAPIRSTADVCMGCAISADEKYFYMFVQSSSLNTYGYMLKFDFQTGAELWRTTAVYDETDSGDYDMAIDHDGNAYAGCSNEAIRKFASADGAGSFLTLMGQKKAGASAGMSTRMSYCCLVDEDMGLVIAGGYSLGGIAGDAAYAYNLCVRTFDDSAGAQLALGGWYYDSAWQTRTINSKCIITHDGYIYVASRAPTPMIYKIEYAGGALNVVKEVSGPTYTIGLFCDAYDNLVVVNQDLSPNQTDIFYYYDWDLNYVTKISGMYGDMLETWDAAAGGAWIQGDVAFWPRSGLQTGYDYWANGIVLSVARIPSTDEDEIWLGVLRYINGEQRQFIERFKPRALTTLTDCFFVDCGITVTNDTASATITGLDHLIGEEVIVLGDGVVYTPTAAVDATGSVTISTAVSTAQVGLPYRYKLKPMRPDIQTGQGTTHGSIVKVPEMGISFLNTMNAQYGVNYTDLYDIDWTNAQWTNNTEITGLFTGDVVAHVDGGFTIDNPLIITGDDPLPCTVRALVPRMEKTGR